MRDLDDITWAIVDAALKAHEGHGERFAKCLRRSTILKNDSRYTPWRLVRSGRRRRRVRQETAAWLGELDTQGQGAEMRLPSALSWPLRLLP